MAPPRYRGIKKNELSASVKLNKPLLFSESLGRPSGLVQKIGCVEWSPTGTLLATCTTATIRIWNAERPHVKSSTEIKNAHAKGGVAFGAPGVSGETVEKIAFCPTVEGVLASSGRDGMVRLWDVRVPGGIANLGGRGTALADCRTGNEGTFLTWHPNGREMLLGRDDSRIYSVDVRQMSGADSTPAYTLEATERIHRGSSSTTYYQMAFSNTGREVFATTKGGPVKIFDYPSMSLLHTLTGHPETTYTVQQSPAGTYVAAGSADSTISLWDTHNWFCTHTLSSQSQSTSIKDISFSYDGAYLVAGSGDMARDVGGGMAIYHVDSGEVVHTVETINCPTFVAWHPTRYWIAYAGDPGGLKVVGGAGSVG
ncbi:hypothetical protein LTR36_005273 [Oleoguttula mirabilis]|uniref:WD40 repeat-like protein n=1 Tax=Oleoguttula mirabilis TaxID=1507867 RepID=A0AAV9JFQ3_9PEZI|nr:hypothetical protein LTR36_005273 [Oleoguttula mirabilis]